MTNSPRESIVCTVRMVFPTLSSDVEARRYRNADIEGMSDHSLSNEWLLVKLASLSGQTPIHWRQWLADREALIIAEQSRRRAVRQ